MAYVEVIKARIAARDYNKIMALWQEYCENDTLDAEELIAILLLMKNSDFAKEFGRYVEAILPLVMTIEDENLRFEVLRHMYDVQSSNSQPLYDLALELVKTKFGKEPLFSEKVRLVGLRTRDHFQGALSNFALLNHFVKGNYVFHDAGWGVGCITDSSFVREQVTVEFENLGWNKRDISFKNAFHSLVPLHKDHFLALRRIAPGRLAEEAKDDPVAFVTKILQDLGPKTPSEIKELVCGHIMDATTYTKWWQIARSRLKKNEHIEVPSSSKEPFLIRKEALFPTERVERALQGKEEISEILNALYSTLKDFSEAAKSGEAGEKALEKVRALLVNDGIKDSERLEAYLFVDQVLEKDAYKANIKEEVLGATDIPKVCEAIAIVALRRGFLNAVKVYRKDWEKVFGEALLQVDPIQIKDYLFKELWNAEQTLLLETKLQHLIEHPALYPEAFLWYFQKVFSGDALLLNTQKDKERFFESFLILLSILERKKESKDFVKKMCTILTGNRFQIVRDFLKGTSATYAREFLLLASKCNSLSHPEQKILESLVDVVHKKENFDEVAAQNDSVVWTTEEGYLRTKDRICHIGTVEVVENAKEIESARAHGDLRENAEYKAALERRSRLQSELKQLSDQFDCARIISPGDISTEVVGVGAKVTMEKKSGQEISYTILGQWDADPDKNILSYHSRVAQSLLGKTKGNTFEFLGEPVTVTRIESYK